MIEKNLLLIVRTLKYVHSVRKYFFLVLLPLIGSTVWMPSVPAREIICV